MKDITLSLLHKYGEATSGGTFSTLSVWLELSAAVGSVNVMFETGLSWVNMTWISDGQYVTTGLISSEKGIAERRNAT